MYLNTFNIFINLEVIFIISILPIGKWRNAVLNSLIQGRIASDGRGGTQTYINSFIITKIFNAT